MSEYRNPVEVWIRRLPDNDGKKPHKKLQQKIELFPAHYWAMAWEPGSSMFFPKLPLHGGERKVFWESNYRIRVNGKWVGEEAKYRFYHKTQIGQMYFL